MPIIRLAGSADGLGDAASAFQQSSERAFAERRQDQENQRNRETRLEEIRLRLDRDNTRFQIEQGLLADRERIEDARADRSLDLRERQIESQERLGIQRLEASAQRSGGLLKADSFLRNAVRLSELDPEDGAEFEALFDQLTGGEFDIDSPDAINRLQAHPALPALVAALSPRLKEAEGRHREQQLVGVRDSFIRNASELDPGILDTPEGQQTLIDLQERLSRPRMTARQGEALQQQALADLNRGLGLKRDRKRQAGRIEDLILEHGPGQDDIQWAREMSVKALTSQDPESVFLQVKARLDPESRLIAEQAALEARKSALVGNALVQARQEERAAVASGPIDSAAGTISLEQLAAHNDATLPARRVRSEEFPAIASALSPPTPESGLSDALLKMGVEPGADEVEVQAAVTRWLDENGGPGIDTKFGRNILRKQVRDLQELDPSSLNVRQATYLTAAKLVIEGLGDE